MKVKLISMLLQHFKGIDYFLFETRGANNISVLGTNATGKTTLADAYFWLLFGKDSNGLSYFDIKTIGTSGLDYSVSAIIEIDDVKHTLIRSLKEKWERRNGDVEKQLKGNTTTYIIDGVPVKEKEYKTFIENELIGEGTYQILTDPDYFSGKLDWKKRRELLLSWFSDVSDSEIIDTNSELAELKDLLNGKSTEQLQKILLADKKKLNELLKEIPNRIDEQQRNITFINQSLSGDEEKQISILQAEKAKIEELLLSSSIDEQVATAKTNAEKVKLKIEKANVEFYNKEFANLKDRMAELNCARMNLSTNLFQEKSNLKRLQNELDDINSKGVEQNKLFKYWCKLEYEDNNICPTCKQELPILQINEKIEQFNLNKSKNLKDIQNYCTKLKNEKISIKNQIDICIDKINELDNDLGFVETHITDINNQILNKPKFEETEIFFKLSAELQEAKNIVNSLINQNSDNKVIEYKNKIAYLDKQIQDLQAKLANYSLITSHQKRIDELLQLEKTYAKKLATIDKNINLIDKFIKIKCAEVEKMINSHFKIVKWKLFDLQVNGGICDCCEATVNGVDYSTNLNSASKINAGLDIINVISEKIGSYAPIWIDNAEAVVEFIETKTQVIKLVVNENYKTLTTIINN